MEWPINQPPIFVSPSADNQVQFAEYNKITVCYQFPSELFSNTYDSISDNEDEDRLVIDEDAIPERDPILSDIVQKNLVEIIDEPLNDSGDERLIIDEDYDEDKNMERMIDELGVMLVDLCMDPNSEDEIDECDTSDFSNDTYDDQDSDATLDTSTGKDIDNTLDKLLVDLNHGNSKGEEIDQSCINNSSENSCDEREINDVLTSLEEDIETIVGDLLTELNMTGRDDAQDDQDVSLERSASHDDSDAQLDISMNTTLEDDGMVDDLPSDLYGDVVFVAATSVHEYFTRIEDTVELGTSFTSSDANEEKADSISNNTQAIYENMQEDSTDDNSDNDEDWQSIDDSCSDSEENQDNTSDVFQTISYR